MSGHSQLTLQSSIQKHKPIYKLKVRYEAPSGKKWEDKEIEGTFMEWFNEDGFLQHTELRRWLAKNIDVVGQADSQSQVVDAELTMPNNTPREKSDTPVVVLPSIDRDGTSSVKGRKSKKRA